MGDRVAARGCRPQNLHPPGGLALRHGRIALLAVAAFAAGAAGSLAWTGLPLRNDAPRVTSSTSPAGLVSVQQAAVAASARVFDWLPEDPAPSAEPRILEITPEARLRSAFRARPVGDEAGGEASEPPHTERAWPRPSVPAQETTQSIQPAPRPSGLNPAPDSALGYAALEAPGRIPTAPGIRLSPSPSPDPAPGPGIAVYDISARVVYMPNGEKLEAHSGLRDKLDDPRHVHVRMRGATPPGVYDLREREKLFHGVRALRLNPVGGSAAVHGRTGLLAHTYMLGPKGDSNGCLVFKNYDRFLQAYLKGEVKRLVVVAGRGQDAPPAGSNRVATPWGSGAFPGDG